MNQITLREWRRSIIALGFQITQLNHKANQLNDAATARGEFLFSDYGVPMPRPCTAMAWASLCSFGPVNGIYNVRKHELTPFNPSRGNFLVPFLPKIMANEETDQSLSRTSRAHVKDPQNRIRWGNIFIADSSTGEIVEQLPHGQRVAKEWMDSLDSYSMIPSHSAQHEVPALFAYTGEGWQFGVIQNLPSVTVMLRDPMTELAKRGILELKYGGMNSPKVRRLLIRFLDIQAAKRWAEGYAQAMQSIFDRNAIHDDIQQLLADILEARKDSEEKKPKKSKPGISVEFKDAFDDLLSMFGDSNKPEEKEQK